MTNLPTNTGYKKLILYQKAKLLVVDIYHLTQKYPKTEIYGLVPQMRRCSVSVLANIVEGYAKGTSKEYSRFLSISIGSVFELEVFLDLSLDLLFIKQVDFDKILNLFNEVKKLLYGTRKAVRLKG